MKLSKRGEIVFASLLFSAFVMTVSAIVAGGVWLATHHQVIDQSSCKQTIEGVMCDFTWERK
jgi:hypothetical protein